MKTYMNSKTQFLQSAIRMTSTALERVKEICNQQQKDPSLRIGVRQGGCSGMSYLMNFENPKDIQPEDRVFSLNGVRVVCDPKSLSYLDGLIVDYSHTTIGLGGEFQFMNPQATQTCCCGQSFTTAIPDDCVLP